MEWRTDEPPKTGQRILAAVEAVRYNWSQDDEFTEAKYVTEVVWRDGWRKCWTLDDESSEYHSSPVKFTKWTPFPEYPK